MPLHLDVSRHPLRIDLKVGSYLGEGRAVQAENRQLQAGEGTRESFLPCLGAVELCR